MCSLVTITYIFGLAACAGWPHVPAHWGDRRSPRKSLTLDDYYLEYRTLGLPMPEHGSKLVKEIITYYSWSKETKKVSQNKITGYGLYVINKNPWIQPEIWYNQRARLDGFRQPILKANEYTVVDPFNKAFFKELDSVTDCIVFAIHCHHLGWSELSRYAFDRAKKNKAIDEDPERPNTDPLLNVVYEFAIRHYYDMLLDFSADRKNIAHKLKYLSQHYHCDNVLHDMCLFAANNLFLKPAQDPKDKAIDDLFTAMAEGDSEAWGKIVSQGEKAIPALLRHMYDTRYDFSYFYAGFNLSFRRHPGLISKKCKWYLSHLTDDAVSEFTTDKPFVYEFKNWWMDYLDAKKKYLEEKVPLGEYKNAYEIMNTRIDKKSNFIQLIESGYVGGIGAHTEFTCSEIISMVRPFLDDQDWQKRKTALLYYEYYGGREFDRELLKTLKVIVQDKTFADEIDRDVYGMLISSSNAGVLDCLVDIPLSNNAYSKLYFLDNLARDYEQAGIVQRIARLQMIMKLLDDAQLFVVDQVMFQDVIKHFQVPGDSATVRNYAAGEFAQKLGIAIEWNPDRTEKEWERIRTDVKAAVSQEQKRLKAKRK